MVIILCNIADFSRTSRTYYIIIASVTAHLRKQVLAISDFITSIQTSHKIEAIGFSVSSNPLLYYFWRICWCISTLIVNGIIWLHMLTSSLSNLAVLTLPCTNSPYLNKFVLLISDPKQTTDTRKDELFTEVTRTSQKSNADNFVHLNDNDVLDCLASFYGDVSWSLLFGPGLGNRAQLSPDQRATF